MVLQTTTVVSAGEVVAKLFHHFPRPWGQLPLLDQKDEAIREHRQTGTWQAPEETRGRSVGICISHHLCSFVFLLVLSILHTQWVHVCACVCVCACALGGHAGTHRDLLSVHYAPGTVV